MRNDETGELWGWLKKAAAVVAVAAWVRTIVSAFRKDPVERAESRRYQLK